MFRQNIEGIPGGFNHLRRLHEEVAEPLQNAFSGGNNFQSENNNNNATSTEAQQEENTSALPNPWGGNSNANSNENNAGNSRVPGVSI